MSRSVVKLRGRSGMNIKIWGHLLQGDLYETSFIGLVEMEASL